MRDRNGEERTPVLPLGLPEAMAGASSELLPKIRRDKGQCEHVAESHFVFLFVFLLLPALKMNKPFHSSFIVENAFHPFAQGGSLSNAKPMQHGHHSCVRLESRYVGQGFGH